MKLTKGKIAKLYGKPRQSLKKKGKSKRGTGKGRTFRQNRKVNLARRTMKRVSYLGGTNPDIDPLGLKQGLDATETGLTQGLDATETGLKQGLDATETGLKQGLDATETGLTQGLDATETGLTQGLDATETGLKQGLDATETGLEKADGILAAAPPIPQVVEARMALEAANAGVSTATDAITPLNDAVLTTATQAEEEKQEEEVPTIISNVQNTSDKTDTNTDSPLLLDEGVNNQSQSNTQTTDADNAVPMKILQITDDINVQNALKVLLDKVVTTTIEQLQTKRNFSADELLQQTVDDLGRTSS